MAELRQAEHHTQRNPWVDFLMAIMASGIACGRVFTKKLPNNDYYFNNNNNNNNNNQYA